MKKAIAEFIGTFALVFIGCGTIVVGGMATGSTAINELAIALAFGLTIVAMAYGIGQISGCHVNPAVSFGVYSAGRMTLEELLIYCVAQIAGAIAAALVLYVILSGKASGWNGALGQTTWSEYGAFSAFIFEVVGTFLFLVCILGVTQRGAPVELAGIAIGLTLAAIHLVGINISGSSLNPARSLGPALVGFAHNQRRACYVWSCHSKVWASPPGHGGLDHRVARCRCSRWRVRCDRLPVRLASAPRLADVAAKVPVFPSRHAREKRASGVRSVPTDWTPFV